MSFIGRTTAKTVSRMKEGIEVFDKKIAKLYKKHSAIDEKFDILIQESENKINEKRVAEHLKVAMQIKEIQDARQKAVDAIDAYEQVFTKEESVEVAEEVEEVVEQ